MSQVQGGTPGNGRALKSAQMPEKYIQEKAKIFHGKGCRSCNNIGYTGRMCLLEVFIINDEIRKMVVARNTASEIKKQLLPLE